MRVYAESNFVLELVLSQEEHQSCEELVKLAAAQIIELVVPAFALLEPYHTNYSMTGSNRAHNN